MAQKKGDPEQITQGIQSEFFNRLRKRLPPGIGMAEELSSILGISLDSAYRRLRGETDLTIEEVAAVMRRYTLSVDDICANKRDTVSFSYTKLTNSAANFEEYLARIVQHLQTLNKFENRRIHYVAEEMPLFYSFYSPVFTDFKLYYWQRSVLNCPEYQQDRYEPGLITPNALKLAKESYTEYLKVPSTEVWTDLTVLTGLRQINFYFESGVLDKQMALTIFHEYKKTIEMLQKCAENGRKNVSDQSETFFMYSSEVVLGTNCIYTVMGDNRYSFISFNTLNSLTTSNPEFCEETEHWVRNLEKKSSIISGVAEKQRYQFFSAMYRKIDSFIEKTANS
jgi:hypothetical protein